MGLRAILCSIKIHSVKTMQPKKVSFYSIEVTFTKPSRFSKRNAQFSRVIKMIPKNHDLLLPCPFKIKR